MSTRKFQQGDKVIVSEKVAKYYQTSRNVKPGMSGTVLSYHYDGYYTVKIENGHTIKDKAAAFNKGKGKNSIEIFEEQISLAEKKIESTLKFIQDTKAKIEFMKETNTESFNDNEFKAFQTLTIIEQGNMTKIEKARAIASLISNK